MRYLIVSLRITRVSNLSKRFGCDNITFFSPINWPLESSSRVAARVFDSYDRSYGRRDFILAVWKVLNNTIVTIRSLEISCQRKEYLTVGNRAQYPKCPTR